MEFSIPFRSLKEGKHLYEFEINDAFLNEFENEELENADLSVSLELEKKTNLIILTFGISGMIDVQCDRCLDFFSIPVEYSGKLYVKFGYEEVDNPEIIVLHPETDVIELKQIIYELIILNIPIRNIHPENEHGESTCNAEMIKILEKHLVDEDDKPADSRWDKLNELFN